MEWLNEPANWQRTGDVLTVSVDPNTDFWRQTGYGYIRDNGHVYGEVIAGDFDVSVRVHCVLEDQYDQAGVMLRADDQTWLKTGVEFFEGRPRLSTVLTLGRSSWLVADLPDGPDDLLLRVSRRGDAVEVRYLVGDGQPKLAALVFMPPDRAVLAGVMCAAPGGSGFRVSFHDLQISERDWSAPGGEAGEWVGEPAGWDDREPLPAWDGGPGESQRRDWASGPESTDHPSWPAGGVTPVDDSDWALDGPGEDDPDWPKKLAMEEDPDWATEIGAATGTGAATEDSPGGAPEQPKDEQQTRTPAPAAADAVADWDRLAAGAQEHGRTPTPAERWSAQADADVATEWPGPPLRAAQRPGMNSGPAAGDEATDEQAEDEQTGNGQAGDEQASAGSGPAAAGPEEARRAKQRKSAPAGPPADPPGEPDPADEWISMLTPDPAEE